MSQEIKHPKQPVEHTSVLVNAPKYLIRNSDGVVFIYNEERAKLEGFTPSNVLPAQHIESIKAAEIAEQLVQQATAAAQEKFNTEVTAHNNFLQETLDTELKENSNTAKAAPDAQFKIDEGFIASASRKALAAYANTNFNAELNAESPIDELRQAVRKLCAKRREIM